MPSTAPTARAVLDGGPAITPAPGVLDRLDAQVAATPGGSRWCTASAG